MITFWKQYGREIRPTESFEPGCWVNVVSPTLEELELLQAQYHIPTEVTTDVLDADERARFEREDDYFLIIIRIPYHDAHSRVPYTTIPLGVVLRPDAVFTICLRDNELIRDITERRVRGVSLASTKAFVFTLFLRSASWFMKYLRDINRETSLIEEGLQRSVENRELVQLLVMEKCLVYFTTALKSNEFLMERLQRNAFGKLTEDEGDLLEDVLIENRQAIEMANIYSNILSGLMNAFASVINNNMNQVMKQLTLVSVVLMGPTFLASLYGMNVKLPGVSGAPNEGSPVLFFIILGLSLLIGISTIMLMMALSRWSTRGRWKPPKHNNQ